MTPSTASPEHPSAVVATADHLPDPVVVPPDEQARLLDLARVALAAASGAGPPDSLERAIASGPLPERWAAAFVTLTEDGELRGCMGSLDGAAPAWVSVIDAATWAARSDLRFRSVTPGELAEIHVDVSILGPLVRLEDPLAFRPGTDGIVVAREGRRGLLLPEVAAMVGFDRVAMLDACCDKAGLGHGAWRDAGTKVHAFRTHRFGGPAVPVRSGAGRDPAAGV